MSTGTEDRDLAARCQAGDAEAFEHKEIAAMLGIAEGTSKSQVFNARVKLRALL